MNPLESLSRRRLLFGGSALLAVSWVGVHVFGHRPHPDADSPFLGDGPLATLTAALEALLYEDVDARALASGIDAALAEGDPVLGGELRVALRVLEHTGGVGMFQGRSFSRRTLEERRRILQSWEASDWETHRMIFQALRRLAMFSWFSSPGGWEQVGYDGTWVKR